MGIPIAGLYRIFRGLGRGDHPPTKDVGGMGRRSRLNTPFCKKNATDVTAGFRLAGQLLFCRIPLVLCPSASEDYVIGRKSLRPRSLESWACLRASNWA